MSKLYVDEIRNSDGSVSALTIDSSGRLLQPAKPAFSCRPTANIDITATGWKTVDFNTVDFDVGSNLNSAGYYTVPVDGIYQFNYHARFANIGSGYIVIALSDRISSHPTTGATTNLFTNSYVLFGNPATNYDSPHTSILIELDAGTNVQPWVYSADSSYRIDTVSHFSGFLVG